jgi:nitrite reductase (NADH) large subunit
VSGLELSILRRVGAEPLSTFSRAEETNDKFMANIQRNGTFSVVPRIAGGEVSPEGLIAIGQVAKEYGLYTKITG